MRILVTGGAGYVGGFTARHLIRSGHEVVVLDNLCRGHRQAIPPEILVVGDVGDGDILDRIFRHERIDAVMHFAAFALVGESVEHPHLYYQNNVACTLRLLESMRAHQIGRIVFSSSCAVYGENAATPLHEEIPTHPSNPYAMSKLTVEQMIGDFSQAYGLRYVLLRYFNAAGANTDGTHGEAHEPETHLIPLALRAAAEGGEPLRIFGNDYPTPDGTCIRDYVHVDDLARAHELAVHASNSGVFNIGTGRGHSNLEVLRGVERVTGRRVSYELAERRPGDPARLVANAERILAGLGWTPRYADLDAILTTAWAWHGQHPRGYEP